MGTTVLSRLNRVELANTLSDLFGPLAPRHAPSGADPAVLGFDTNAGALTVSESTVEAWLNMAEAVAGEVDLSSLGPCADPVSRSCADARVSSLALRVLRRPATSDERASYLALWDEVEARVGSEAATRAVIARLLVTPDFLYHVELGDADGALDGYGFAARLSFLAWETTPDDTLLAAVGSGALDTEPGRRAQVERLFSHPRAAQVLRRFFDQWLGVDRLTEAVKDPSTYPEFDALKASLREDPGRMLEELIGRDGTVAELFTTPHSMADPALARFYGVSHPGVGWAPVVLDPAERPGLFTRASFLAMLGKANKSAPILRGHFLREKVLCAPVPPPPPGAATVPPDAPIPTTTRAYYENLTSPAVCQECHTRLNPMGFVLEGYDGIGCARQSEHGYPVDTRGAITAGDVAGPVADARALAERLAVSASARTCLATQWFRSRFRRVEEGNDHLLIEAVVAAAEGDRVLSLARALAAQPAFSRIHLREPHDTEASR